MFADDEMGYHDAAKGRTRIASKGAAEYNVGGDCIFRRAVFVPVLLQRRKGHVCKILLLIAWHWEVNKVI